MYIYIYTSYLSLSLSLSLLRTATLRAERITAALELWPSSRPSQKPQGMVSLKWPQPQRRDSRNTGLRFI